MLRHHFAQCMCILNSDDCNIFENLSRNEFEKVLDLMRDIILATDLAHHLRIIGDLEDMAKTGYKRDNRTHRMHLLFLLMTSCDLSDQTKHWKNTKKIANLIYQEFFSQGDMEKAQGKKPLEMMDRDKAEIPHLQISFLDSIALPVYRILAKIFPEAEGILGAVEQNRQMWVTLNAKLKSLNLPTNMDLFEAKLDDDCFS